MLAIDDFRRDHGSDAWDEMISALAAVDGPAIVESVLLPVQAQEIARDRHALVCQVVCPERERKKRVSRRGWTYSPPPDWTDVAELVDVRISGTTRPTDELLESLIVQAENQDEPRALASAASPTFSREW